MKKLFYRLSSSRSFAKLFSLLAGVVLGSLFAQPAFAQDFFFGWEPFPPSSWDGGWDASLSCQALDGTTTLTRTPPKGPDTRFDHGGMIGASVDQEGKVNCTFTDPNNKTCGSPNCNRKTGFKETASCLLSFEWRNLKEECVNNNNGSSTLTVTGQCPFKKGDTIVGPTLEGTIDCRGRNPDGSVNLYKNPEFCSYQGNDPDGNPTKDCQWRLGFGALKQNQGPSVASFGSNVMPVVPLTQQQCNDAFGDSPQLFSFTQTPTVFSFEQTFADRACMGSAIGAKGPQQSFCHADTWNSKQDPFCNFSPTSTATIGTSFVQSSLIADTEYTPKTINPKCDRHDDDDDDDVITLTVLANAVDPGTNDVALNEINQKKITVNGRPIIRNSCRFDKFGNLTCKVKQCVKGESIIADTTDVKAGTATLLMEGLMNDETPVVGDVETVRVSKKDNKDDHDDDD